MDPFSLAVGISSLVALTGQTLKLTRQYCQGVKHATKSASALAESLQLLHDVLCRLEEFLHRDGARGQSFKHTSVVVSSASACKAKVEALYKTLDAVEISRLNRALWPLNEKEHQQSIQELRAIAHCIQFAMTIDQCALLSDTSEDVIELLQRQLETLQILRQITYGSTSLEIAVKEQTQILRNGCQAQERNKILDWITVSDHDNENKHNVIRRPRVADTGVWLLNAENFLRWREGVELPNALWCHGIQGSGKSVLSSMVIDHLKDLCVGQNFALAFFYFDYRDRDSHLTNVIVADLLRQIASQQPVLAKSLCDLYTKFNGQSRTPQLQDFENAFLDVCLGFDKVFIAVDALDECDELMCRRPFLRFLSSLQQCSKIRLFVASRPHPEDIQHTFSQAPQLKIEASEDDLRKYLRERIEDSSSTAIIDEAFKQHLIDTIADSAQKMFLLPALQVSAIINEPTVGDMADALEVMPRGLHEAFYQTLRRIQGQPDGRKRLGMNILLWISHARGTLTVKELSEAIAIRSETRCLDPRRRPSGSTMVQCCLGLVAIDQESSSVRLVHYALQEFFEDQGAKIFPSGHDELADSCLTYLFLNDFAEGCLETEIEIAQTIEDFPLLRYSSSYWGNHVRLSQGDQIYRWALDFLRCQPRRALSIQIRRFAQEYREEYWEPDEVLSHTAFHDACAFGLSTVVNNMLQTDEIDLDATTRIGTTPLITVASCGHIELLKTLLRLGADTRKANWYGTALHCAAEQGQCESIKVLLGVGMDINQENTFNRSPLLCAGDRRCTLAIELLLDMGADQNACDDTGMMLIHDVAQVGDGDLMRRLLRDGKTDVAAKTAQWTTALHNAAIGGHANVVKMLLSAGAAVTARDKGGYTALHLAADWGRTDVVRLLIEAGADANAEANDGSTPWFMAFTAGHEEIDQLLREHEAAKGLLSDWEKDVLLAMGDDDETHCPSPDYPRRYKNLKAHTLAHQLERREKCPIPNCAYYQKGFARKYDKNRHILTHYKGGLVCGFCPESGSVLKHTFNRADVFKRHLTTVHGVRQTPPNARKKNLGSSTNSEMLSQAVSATGKCSICSATFNNTQEFYEHFDDCILRVVQH